MCVAMGFDQWKRKTTENLMCFTTTYNRKNSCIFRVIYAVSQEQILPWLDVLSKSNCIVSFTIDTSILSIKMIAFEHIITMTLLISVQIKTWRRWTGYLL